MDSSAVVAEARPSEVDAHVNIAKLTFMYPNAVLSGNAVRADTRQHLLLDFPSFLTLTIHFHFIMTPLLAQLLLLLPLAVLLLPFHSRLLHLMLLLSAKLRVPLLGQLSHTSIACRTPLAHEVRDGVLDFVVQGLQLFGGRRVTFGVRAVGPLDQGFYAEVGGDEGGCHGVDVCGFLRHYGRLLDRGRRGLLRGRRGG